VVPDGHFGIRVVSGAPSVPAASSDAQAAYEQGKQEGTAVIHAQLALVAKQVYGNVQEQLDVMEKEEKENAKQKVSNLKDRLSSCKPITQPCPQQEAQFVACLSKGDALACRGQLDALVACATDAVVSSAGV